MDNRQEDPVPTTQLSLPTLDALSAQFAAAAVDPGATPSTPSQGFRRGQQAADQAEPAKRPSLRTNKYAADCSKCGRRVDAGAGLLSKATGKWLVEHVGECPAQIEVEASSVAREGERPVTLDPANPPLGIYTVEDAEGHVTLRVWQQQMDDDFAPGEVIIEHLVGRDNEKDYERFGFLKGGRLIVWKKHRPLADGDPEKRYVRAARVLLADPASVLTAMNCPRCNAVLSHPDSVTAKIGPECKKAWGW